MTSFMVRPIAAALIATLLATTGAFAQDRRVGAKYRADYLARWLRDPSYLRPSTHMPAIELTEADIAALAAFLAAQQ